MLVEQCCLTKITQMCSNLIHKLGIELSDLLTLQTIISVEQQNRLT